VIIGDSHAKNSAAELQHSLGSTFSVSFFFFFLRHYNFREVLAFSTNSFHLGRFLMQMKMKISQPLN